MTYIPPVLKQENEMAAIKYEVELTDAEVEALCKFIDRVPASLILTDSVYLGRALRKILELR